MSLLSTIKSAFFNKEEPTIKFKCDIGLYDIGQPVKRAMDVKPDWMKQQAKAAERLGHSKFSACPGMQDFYRAGYIIPAWEDFEILVDSKSISVKIGTEETFVCKPYQVMDHRVVDGVIDIDENMKLHAIKLPCPWKVFTKSGYSAFVIPATYHSPFLRDLCLYPGINDYDQYHTINVMLTPLRPMHIKIYAGTPMLQVIPVKREPITAEVGTITREELGKADFLYRSKAPGLYRKLFYQPKTTDITYL